VPGPAAYRRGGPLTVTDCNVMLGKLRPAFFPAVFGPGADQPLDVEAVKLGFETLAADILAATGEAMSPEAIAEGFITIAVENMAKAVRQISIQRGYDVTRYVLACFGGAGGQHACLVADALGMTRVMIHPFAGVLSAYGMGLADLRLIREATVERPLAEAAAELTEQARALSVEAEAALLAQGVPVASVEALATLRVKYAGTDTPLVVPLTDEAGVRATFETLHQRRFGFISPTTALVVETLSVEAVGHADAGAEPALGAARSGEVEPLATVEVRMAGQVQSAPVFDREVLAVGTDVKGPAIIREATGTTIVEPGWRATVDAHLNLILDRIEALPTRRAIGTKADPVMLEVFNNLFMAVAEEMGFALQNTAYSVNIKERLDFSCALFDRDGNLIANAPHMPVHLGSMGDSVRAIREARTLSPIEPRCTGMCGALAIRLPS
ncbi:hydantoinase/oxoprolinase family protein, partial [Caulobacter sp. HMWF009]|uniref:hydantoinase/oxoprolinase family protein n=1 Tax=Caulobacter sp. HMWF009 TaxID=2056846 RepID=UPI000D434658